MEHYYPVYLPQFYLPPHNFQVKIKQCCYFCASYFMQRIQNGTLLPLLYGRLCPRCRQPKICQPYQVICTLCSHVGNICSACARNPVLDLDISIIPYVSLMTPNMHHFYKLLPTYLKQQFNRALIRNWKRIQHSSVSVDAVQRDMMEALFELIFCHYILVSKPNVQF